MLRVYYRDNDVIATHAPDVVVKEDAYGPNAKSWLYDGNVDYGLALEKAEPTTEETKEGEDRVETRIPTPVYVERKLSIYWVDGGKKAVVTFGAIPEDAILAPIKEQVPVEVTMGQAREALIDAKLHTKVDDFIQNLPGIEGDKARAAWEYRLSVRRDSPLIVVVAKALNLTDDAIDDLFISAAKL